MSCTGFPVVFYVGGGVGIVEVQFSSDWAGCVLQFCSELRGEQHWEENEDDCEEFHGNLFCIVW